MQGLQAGVSHADKNNIYHINIDFTDTDFGFVRRLAHELIHVKQMETGRLKFIDKESFLFDNEIINYIEYNLKQYDVIFKHEEEAFNGE